MTNKIRPRCKDCGQVMTPLYRKRPRGHSMVRAGLAFQCVEDQILAKTTPGRRVVQFL